jgi:hypothetical protein
MARQLTHRTDWPGDIMGGPYQESPWQPAADIYRSLTGWLVKFDLAGVRPQDIQVTARDHCLMICGVRRDWLIREGHHSHSMAVRLIAGHKYRVQQIMERRHLNFEEARDYVEKTDADRRAFVQQYFHHDASDPHLFDLVINVEKFGPEPAARQITDAVTSCLHVTPSS